MAHEFYVGCRIKNIFIRTIIINATLGLHEHCGSI